MFIPVEKPFKITSPYGNRIIFGKEEFHNGIDFISLTGLKDVYAMLDGEIIADMDNYDHEHRWEKPNTAGNWIKLKHELKEGIFYTVYFHLKYNKFNVGDFVKKAQFIGEYGNCGRSTGPHLHIGLLNSKHEYINPTSWFKF